MYKKMYLLPGISILAIVIAHSVSFGLIAVTAWSSQYSSLLPANYNPYVTLDYYLLVFIRNLVFFGVPFFFFISGLFVSYTINKKSGNIQWSTIKIRVLTLLIPFLIWTIITILIDAITGHFYSLLDYSFRFIVGINGYWFIPVLILFYLVSPWIISLAKTRWKLLLIICGFIQIFILVLKYQWLISIDNAVIKVFNDQILIFFVSWIFYFPFGIVLGIHYNELIDWIVRFRWFSFTVCCISLLAAFWVSVTWLVYTTVVDNWSSGVTVIFSHIYTIALLLTYFGFTELKIPLSKEISKVGVRSYGIYLTHYIFMLYVAKFIYHIFPTMFNYQIIFTPLMFISGLGGSLLLMWIVIKSPVKGVYPYLFG